MTNASFTINWQQQQVVCPLGQSSMSWQPFRDNSGNPLLRVSFSQKTCGSCPMHQQCVQSPKRPRILTFKPQAQYLALQAARQRQTTKQWQQLYAQRAGVEGTLSQGVRAHKLRRSRYISLAKTHLQHVATAAAINLARLQAWWQQIPKAHTRHSAFAALLTVEEQQPHPPATP